MLNELNIIARGLLGLHGYPIEPPRPAAPPVQHEPVTATALETRVRTSTEPARRSLALHAQGSR